MAAEAGRSVVKAAYFALGESGAQCGARSIDQGHWVLGTDFPTRRCAALSDVQRCAPVLRAVAVEGWLPDRAGAGEPPAEAARLVALQHLESVTQGGDRPARRRLAD